MAVRCCNVVVLSATVFAHNPTITILASQRSGGKSIDVCASRESCVERILMGNDKCVGTGVRRPLAPDFFTKENSIG